MLTLPVPPHLPAREDRALALLVLEEVVDQVRLPAFFPQLRLDELRGDALGRDWLAVDRHPAEADEAPDHRARQDAVGQIALAPAHRGEVQPAGDLAPRSEAHQLRVFGVEVVDVEHGDYVRSSSCCPFCDDVATLSGGHAWSSLCGTNQAAYGTSGGSRQNRFCLPSRPVSQPAMRQWHPCPTIRTNTSSSASRSCSTRLPWSMSVART